MTSPCAPVHARFNEAEAIKPRNQRQAHDLRATPEPASMRPRQSSLGILEGESYSDHLLWLQ